MTKDAVFAASSPAMPAAVASPRLKRLQWVVLALLVVGYMLVYIDRATLAVANPMIRQDMGISVAEMGLLLSAFLWTNCVCQIPLGFLIDKLQPRLVLYGAMIFWSIAQILGGWVGSLGQFFGARILLGVGEAPYTVTASLATRDWFNVRDRGFATGIWSAGSTLGSAVSVPLLTYLMLAFGWRSMFIIMGLGGLVVALVFYALYHNPAQMSLTAAEKASLAEGDQPRAERPMIWRDRLRLFRFPTTWGLAIGWFGPVYVAWFYFAWLPNYLETAHHISIAKTGWVGAIPFAVGVLGSILGGRTTDMLVKRGVSALDSRRYHVVVSMLITGVLTVVVAETASTAVAVACISISLLTIYVAAAALLSAPPIAAPGEVAGAIGGIQAFGGYIGSALAPMVTGFIVQATGSFELALLLGAGVAIVSAVIHLVLARKPISPAELEGALA